METSRRVTIHIPESLEAALRERDSNLSASLRDALERYLDLVRHECAALNDMLSDGEIGMIFDVMRKRRLRPGWERFLPDHIDVAGRLDRLDQKWGVEAPDLAAKLTRMNRAQLVALVDAAARHWQRASVGENPSVRDALK